MRELRPPFRVGGGTAYKSQRQNVSIISSVPETMVTIAAARIAAVPVLLCGSGIEPLGIARTQLKRTLHFRLVENLQN